MSLHIRMGILGQIYIRNSTETIQILLNIRPQPASTTFSIFISFLERIPVKPLEVKYTWRHRIIFVHQ